MAVSEINSVDIIAEFVFYLIIFLNDDSLKGLWGVTADW